MSRVLPMPASPSTAKTRILPWVTASRSCSIASRSARSPDDRRVVGANVRLLQDAATPSGSASVETRRRCGRRAGARSRTPPDLEHPPLRREALEAEQAAIDEVEVAHAGGELLGHLRDEDLSALGLRGDARRRVDGGAVQRARLAENLAGVQADADLDHVIGPGRVVDLEAALDPDRALDRFARRAERDHEPVAHEDDLSPAEDFDLLAQHLLVGAHDLLRDVVALARAEVGRALDVREKDGDGPFRELRRSGGDGGFVHDHEGYRRREAWATDASMRMDRQPTFVGSERSGTAIWPPWRTSGGSSFISWACSGCSRRTAFPSRSRCVCGPNGTPRG